MERGLVTSGKRNERLVCIETWTLVTFRSATQATQATLSA